jgi:hypothetical protein
LFRSGLKDRIENPSSRITLNWVYLAGDDADLYVKTLESEGVHVEFNNMGAESSAVACSVPEMMPYDPSFLLFQPIIGRWIKMGGGVWSILGGSQRGGSGGQLKIRKETQYG